jgi:hypothetical protein
MMRIAIGIISVKSPMSMENEVNSQILFERSTKRMRKCSPNFDALPPALGHRLGLVVGKEISIAFVVVLDKFDDFELSSITF